MSTISIVSSFQPIKNERDDCSSNPFMTLPIAGTLDKLRAQADFTRSYSVAKSKKYAVLGQKSIPFNKLMGLIGKDPDNIFKTLETVSDDYPRTLKIHEIRKGDAAHFLKLFSQIKKGETNLEIEGDAAFRNEVLKNIGILLNRPSGRRLIGAICSLKRKTTIKSAPVSATRLYEDDPKISVRLNFNEKIYTVCLDRKKELTFKINPPFMILAHELIHALHFDWKIEADSADYKETSAEFRSPSPHASFTNLNEQLTIAGLSDDEDILSENMIRSEFNLQARFGHIGSDFPSYTDSDLAEIDTPNQRGVTRLENAVNLKARNEIVKLLNAGANPANGLTAAILQEDLETLQFMMRLGVDPNGLDDSGDTAIHTAAKMQTSRFVEHLIERGVQIDKRNMVGERPIDLAIDSNNLRGALLLVKAGASLDKEALSHLSIEIPSEIRMKFLKLARQLERQRMRPAPVEKKTASEKRSFQETGTDAAPLASDLPSSKKNKQSPQDKPNILIKRNQLKK